MRTGVSRTLLELHFAGGCDACSEGHERVVRVIRLPLVRPATVRVWPDRPVCSRSDAGLDERPFCCSQQRSGDCSCRRGSPRRTLAPQPTTSFPRHRHRGAVAGRRGSARRASPASNSWSRFHFAMYPQAAQRSPQRPRSRGADACPRDVLRGRGGSIRTQESRQEVQCGASASPAAPGG